MLMDACNGLAYIEANVGYRIFCQCEQVLHKDLIDIIWGELILHHIDEMDCLNPQHEALVSHQLVEFELDDALEPLLVEDGLTQLDDRL